MHGITKEGKRITLLEPMVKNRQMNLPGIANELYYAHFLCIGHHFLSDDEEIFRKSLFRFERLEEWLVSRPFDQSWDFDSLKLNIEVDKGPVKEMTSFPAYKIGKSANMNTKSSSTNYTIDVMSFLFCESDQPRSMSWHFVAATRMQELASLCTGHYLPLTHLKLIVSQTQDDNKNRPVEIEIFAQMQHPQSGSRPKHEIPLFALSELLRADDRAVENWFDQYNILSPAINLFFAITGERMMFVNVRFLLAIQAIEVFHRRTANGSLMEKAEYKNLRKQLVAAIPADLPKDITEKLTGLYAFANEQSLMQRLTSIISEVNIDFEEEVKGFSAPYARSVVDTRNYNTHFTASLEPKALDGAGMHWATRRMILLLTYLFLKKIGVPAGSFREALERHREFRSLICEC
ncbi:HEPN domain-containing protein [Sphingomonas aerolata]|uniref:HEPN domain-containing protein n=1 Tax=Sphingomonas aerolata TaxID=185951 RepID=UPI002FE41BC4